MGPLVFDKTINTGWIIVNVIALIGIVWLLIWGSKIKKQMWMRLIVAFIGVACFELITWSLRKIEHLWTRAYWYTDVSRVLTILWTIVIVTATTIVDTQHPKRTKVQQFFATLGITTILWLIIERFLRTTTIISYSPEAIERISWYIGALPFEAFYYIPVFMTLCICFYKYRELQIDWNYSKSTFKINHRRDILLWFIGVLSFQILIDPMIIHQNLPSRSYIFHNVNILICIGWLVVLTITNTIIGKRFQKFDLSIRFSYALAISTLLGLGYLGILINTNVLVFSQSIMTTYSQMSFIIPGIKVVSVIAFSTPMFLALIICFVRYWKYTLDQKK